MLTAAIALGWGGTAFGVDSVAVGIVANVEFGTTPVGDPAMLELGAEWAGLHSYDEGRWLFQWDSLAAGKAGYVADQRPFLSLAGGHALGWGELGYRFVPSSRWSPYAGLRLGVDGRILLPPGVSPAAMDTINSVDGVGGMAANGIGRATAGASMLVGAYSVLVTAFLGEALYTPGVYTPGQSFTQGGLGLRFDVERSFVATLEGTIGVTPARNDPTHGLTDRTTREAICTSFRKIFRNGMWVGGSASLARDTDVVAYVRGRTFSTGDAPVIGLTLEFGVRPWRQSP